LDIWKPKLRSSIGVWGGSRVRPKFGFGFGFGYGAETDLTYGFGYGQSALAQIRLRPIHYAETPKPPKL